MNEESKQHAINMRKRPRKIIIPASDKPTEIIVRPDAYRRRVLIELPKESTIEGHYEDKLEEQ